MTGGVDGIEPVGTPDVCKKEKRKRGDREKDGRTTRHNDTKEGWMGGYDEAGGICRMTQFTDFADLLAPSCHWLAAAQGRWYDPGLGHY